MVPFFKQLSFFISNLYASVFGTSTALLENFIAIEAIEISIHPTKSLKLVPKRLKVRRFQREMVETAIPNIIPFQLVIFNLKKR